MHVSLVCRRISKEVAAAVRQELRPRTAHRGELRELQLTQLTSGTDGHVPKLETYRPSRPKAQVRTAADVRRCDAIQTGCGPVRQLRPRRLGSPDGRSPALIAYALPEEELAVEKARLHECPGQMALRNMSVCSRSSEVPPKFRIHRR